MTCSKVAVVAVFVLFLSCSPAVGNYTRYYFATYSPGRPFHGIGAISGGASSPLLVTYPEQQRNEILDYLFKPYFGASLQILKVEIGGDAQSTDGTESSHMHYPWDENYQRGYEWWLMVEARKRNPNIKLYALPYSYPGWLGVNGSTPSPTLRPNVTADYIAKWVHGAYTHYNLTIDYIGLWNERNMTTEYVKTLRKTLDSRGYNNTEIVAPDMAWNQTTIITDLQQDPELAAAVSYVGAHFPGTMAPDAAIRLKKPLWASLDYSAITEDKDGACWAMVLNRNFAAGYMTATISRNLVSSYYSPLPFCRQGLVKASEPWTGHYDVDPTLWITAHTTQFTEIGWRYLQHETGVGLLQGGGSYVAFLSPDGRNVTVVIETMTHDHSACIRPALRPYTVVPQNITIQFAGDIAGWMWEINAWKTKLGVKGQPSTFFEKQKNPDVQHGAVSLSLGVNEIYTITTLTSGAKGQHLPPPPSHPFPGDYRDDFDYDAIGQEPRNLLQQTGSFEVVQSADPGHQRVVRQMVLDTPVAWCAAETIGKAVTLIGNFNWTDVHTEVDASPGKINGTDGVLLAARLNQAGCDIVNSEGVFFYLFPHSQTYAVYSDILSKRLITKGQLSFKVSTEWNHLALLVKGKQVEGSVNGRSVFNVTAPTINDHGFVAFGTNTFGIADFDNLLISANVSLKSN